MPVTDNEQQGVNPGASTIAALDAMEENLRRFGLNHDAAIDPLKNKSLETTDAYMTKIRAAKDERRRLRQEKEFRRYKMNEQQNESDRYLNSVAHSKQLQAVVERGQQMILDGAKTAKALVRSTQRQEEAMEVRQEQLSKADGVLREIVAASEAARIAALPTACDCDFAGLENRSYAGQWRQAAKHDEATKLCERVVHGLVELCFRVSDNRFLPAPSMEGKVVRRVEQDLQVSQWAEWTRECVLNRITGDLPPAEEAEDAALAQNSSGPYDTLDAAAEAEGAARTANEKHLAQDYLRFMVEEHQKKELGDSREAVLDAVELLCNEGERLRKVAMEGIRERYDSSTEHMEQSQVREEVLPQWSQRMPPAACFVHGDDLSGTRLLCDAVERMITQQAQAAMDEANASCTGTILPSGKPAHESGGKGAAASVPTQPPLVGVSKTVGDVKRTYITPRTIMGQAPNKSGGHANVASATKSRQGGNRASNRRLSNDEEDRRELEALADALSREIFSAHMHNLHVLSEGKVPMTTTLNPPTEVHPPKRGSRKEEEKVVEAKPDEHAPPPPLHCLFLLGFPEVEYFYQLLEQKLSPAIESMEIEVVSEWHRKQQEAAEASSPGNRNSGRALGHHSPRPPPKKNNSARSKGKGNQPSMEDASNALVALHAKKSFPPLCIIGHFLTYDIPTRQQRLKDAFIRPFHPSGTATAPSQGHATIQSTPSTLHHNIFSPENAPTHPGPGTSMHLNSTISSVASLAKEKEPKDAGGSASGLSASTTAAVLAFFSRSKVEKVCDTWDVSRLRKELMTQDKRMHAWQRGWQLAFSNTSLSTFKKATAINNALKEKPNKKKSTDRKPAHGAAAHATNDSSTSIGGKLSTSVPETPGSNTKEAFVFPKVLFFYRLEDISATKVSEDVLDQFSKEMQEEAATGANTLRFVSQSLTSSLTSKAELQRGLWVNYLVHRMGEWAIPSRRVFTNESLTMKQLPAPLRLGDYRLPAEVCMELISTHNLYRSRLIPELKSPHEDSTNGPSKLLQTVFHDCATKGSTEAHELALRCELELQRSFMGYVLQVDSTLSQDAFPPQLWSKRGASPDFTSTMHYTSIDQNYEETKEYLETLCANANKTIHDRGAAMLRCAVDLGLNSLADALALLCEFVAKGYYNREIIRSRETHIPGATETVEKSFHPPNAASLASSRLVGGAPETKECGSISALTITGADEPSSELRLSVAPHPSEFFQIKEKFLSSVRRLSPDEARSLLDTLAEEEGDVSSLKRFWSVFDEYGRSIIEQAKDAVMSFIRAVDSDARSFHAQQTSVQTQSLAVESNASQAQDSTTKVPDIVLDGPRETTDDPFNLVALLDWDQLMPSLIDRIVSRTFVLLPEESSGEASDSSNMCPLLPHVITRRRAGDSSMRAIFQPQFVVEDPHSCPLINPNFCRAIVLTREIVQCFSEANIGGLEWLECMYRIALATPPGTGPYPSTTRPISLSELFNPPPRPTLEWEEPPVETRTTPRKRYPWEWRCLEIYLSAMSLFGRQFITESEFVYCASIFQLNVLWMFMDDDFAQLSARVGFPCHEPREPWPSMDVPCCPHRLRFWTEFQLHAPCRSSGPMWDIPSLLSPDELRRLFALHATVRFAGDKFTGPKVFLNVQNWCLDLVMRRCCFCSDVCCEIHRDVSVPEPCTKEVRHMMASFPSYVRSQRDPGEMVLLISPVTACAAWKRNNIQWWEFTPRGDSARWHELTEAGIILPNECTQSCATRVVSTYFSMTRDGLKNKRYAGLPLVLHLLAGFSGSVEGTVERMFHGLAALCYCKEKEKSSGPGVFCDPDGVGPMEADTLELSVEEFAFYFAQLASKGEGINEGVGRLVQPKPGDSEGIPLAEDTQLLLQVEGANSVSLPLLMSSHWGQTLLNAQFKG